MDTFIRMNDSNDAFYFERQGAVMAFYNDCSDELVDWAYSKLCMEPLAPMAEPVFVPRFWKNDDLSRSFIMDRATRPAFPHWRTRRQSGLASSRSRSTRATPRG